MTAPETEFAVDAHHHLWASYGQVLSAVRHGLRGLDRAQADRVFALNAIDVYRLGSSRAAAQRRPPR